MDQIDHNYIKKESYDNFRNLCWKTAKNREFGSFSKRILYQACCKSFSLSSDFQVYSPHTDSINYIDLDRNECRYLLTCGRDARIALFDLSQNSPIESLKTVQFSNNDELFSISSIQWYPFDTGLFISSGFDGEILIWDTNSFSVATNFSIHGKIYRTKMSSIATNHSQIAVASELSTVHLCDLKTGNKSHLLIGHRGPVFDIAWSPRNQYVLASASGDKQIRLWDIRRPGCIMIYDQNNTIIHPKKSIFSFSPSLHRQSQYSHLYSHDGFVTSLEFSPDGIYLISEGSDKLRCWDTVNGYNNLIHYPQVDKGIMKRFCFSHDGELLFYPNEKHISVYQVYSGRHILSLSGHFENINAVIFDNINFRLISAGHDCNIFIWNSLLDQKINNKIKK